jgi:hypothetical protein
MPRGSPVSRRILTAIPDVLHGFSGVMQGRPASCRDRPSDRPGLPSCGLPRGGRRASRSGSADDGPQAMLRTPGSGSCAPFYPYPMWPNTDVPPPIGLLSFPDWGWWPPRPFPPGGHQEERCRARASRYFVPGRSRRLSWHGHLARSLLISWLPPTTASAAESAAALADIPAEPRALDIIQQATRTA